MKGGASMSNAEGQAVEKRFLATVSHEIRTPLNGILGMASLLAETELTPAQSDYVSAIRQSGARLLDLLNNVLDYARMDAAGIELEETQVDLKKISQEVVELLSPRAHAKGIDVCVRCHADFPASLLMDDGRVRQILFNLVGNAIKFTDTGGVLIDLFSPSNSETVCIDIVDSGPGLSEDAQSRLFSAFEQAESRHRGIDGGVGLGLTIVKRLVDAMGGEITLTSAPGMGARFRVTLTRQSASTESCKSVRQGLPKRIGLAGLSPPLQLSLSAMAYQAGHTPVLRSSTGDDKVDVWVADASLAPRELQRLSRSAPVLALIRPEDREHVDALRAHGCRGYLMRPVRDNSLLEQVEQSAFASSPQDDEAVEKKPSSNTRILVADDNSVNAMIATRTLEKAGFSCATAATGAEAVEAVELTDYDCILMDLRMPVMDGFEAMRQIRSLSAPKNSIPIIAISAEINPDVERAARGAGANAVAAKPLDALTLRSIVERWTQGQKAQA